MRAVAKLQVQPIWELLVQYANGDLESFRKLLTACMCWSGLFGAEPLVFGDDADTLWNVVGAGNRRRGIITAVFNQDDDPSYGFDLCRDVREGLSLDDGAKRYQHDFQRVLTWLVKKSEAAGEAFAFLWTHGRENITIKAEVNTNKNLASLYLQSVSEYGSIASPICKFILDRIDRYNDTYKLEPDDEAALQNDKIDDHNEQLSNEIIPLGICTTCKKFMVALRRSKRYCSDKCRVQDNQAKMTNADKAKKMRKYRADKKKKYARKRSAAEAKLQALQRRLIHGKRSPRENPERGR